MDSLREHNEYGDIPLNRGDLDPDPMAQFARWLDDAEAAGVREANAMVLGTVGEDGVPGSRTVLLRGADARGFTFYTNYDSGKGRALAEHPVATALFPWYLLNRQVIVTATVSRVSAGESDAYFASRPWGSRIAAIGSEQSQPVESREVLEQRVAALEAQYEGSDPPRPDGWGGFLLAPTRIEFWKGRTSRLHDRFVYTRAAGDASPGADVADAAAGPWSITRLQP